MWKLKVLIFLLTWIIPQIVLAEVPDSNFIETFLISSTTDLVNKEVAVVKKLNNFGALVKICSSNLKASNVTTNFTDVFDKYAAKIYEIQTINDFNPVNFTLGNFSVYDYTQFRISTVLSDIKNLQAIKENFRENATILYQLAKEVRKQYLNRYFTMIKLKSKNMLVNRVNREIVSFFLARAAYIHLLNIHIGNYEKMRTYLSNLIRFNIVPTPAHLTLGPMMTSIRAIESKLVPAQQQVITMAKVAARKLQEAQKTVSSSRKVQSSNEFTKIFTKMQMSFDETSSMNDYSLLGWPRFPDVTGDGSTVRLRAKMCDDKDRNYGFSEKMSLKKKNHLQQQKNELIAASAIVKSSARKVQVMSPAISSVINATTNLINAQVNYVSKLNVARIQIKDLKINLLTPTTSTPATTTTSTPATTTTTIRTTTTTTPATTTTKFVQPACGTFLPFNPTDLSFAATYGFSAANNSDGSKIYIGKGDNSAYLGLNSCPARISIDPAKPGAFMSSANGENFDDKTASFLPYHPNLIWGTVNESIAWNYHYGIRMMSGDYPVMIARVNISGVIYVGRFHYGNGLVGMYYYRSDLNQVLKVESNQTFDVLGCDVSDVSCNTKKVYNASSNADYLFHNGIIAGFHYDGSFAYVGYTVYVYCPLYSTYIDSPTRVSTNPQNPGSFMECFNTTSAYEIKSNGTIYVLQKTKNMSWKKTTVANVHSVAGLYEWTDRINYVTYARYQMSNWTMMGRAVTHDNLAFYGWNSETNSALNLTDSTEIEILACN